MSAVLPTLSEENQWQANTFLQAGRREPWPVARLDHQTDIAVLPCPHGDVTGVFVGQGNKHQFPRHERNFVILKFPTFGFVECVHFFFPSFHRHAISRMSKAIVIERYIVCVDANAVSYSGRTNSDKYKLQGGLIFVEVYRDT